MTTQPTNLPVPSESPRDLKFNAGKIDEFVTSLVNTYIDRFGNEHYTIEGLRWLAQQAIASFGWIPVGTFQDGAILSLPNQILKDEAYGEYYRWDGTLPKTVPAGSTPASTGGVGVGAWVSVGDSSLRGMLTNSDFGDALIAVKQPYDNTVSRTQHQKNSDSISILDFKEASDPDWTLAFNRASLVSAQQGKVIFVPAGEYIITDSILLYDADDVYDDQYYRPTGSKFIGEGSNTVIIKVTISTQDINSVFYAKGKRNIHIKGLSIKDTTDESYGYYTPNTATRQQFEDLWIQVTKWGMYLGGSSFVGVELTNIVVQGIMPLGIYGGIHFSGGTSYSVKNCSVFYANYTSFEFSGSYVEIGPLASDDCSGTPYIFNSGSYSVSSLGCEQPDRPNNGTLIKGSSANIQLDSLHTYRQTQDAGTFWFDLSGYVKVSIKQLVCSSDTITNGAMARVSNGAKLEILYSNKVEESWPQVNLYDTETATFATLGFNGGIATIPTFSSTICRDIALPNPDQSAGPYYRIVGGQYGMRGCIGTIYTLRSGVDMNPIAGAYDFNTVGSNIATRAKLVRAAHCDSQSLTDYDAWFTGVYNGTSYLFISMPISGGYRNLGTFFSGVIFGQDRNMFKALLASDISSLTAYPSGTILTAQAV